MTRHFVSISLFLVADYWGGWAAFCVSIVLIGMLTALVGDCASHFGCTVNLKDTVTSITFVALGTSLPGLLLVWAGGRGWLDQAVYARINWWQICG